MARLRVAVLISGRGSNLQALINACAEPAFPAAIDLVISNKPEARGLALAETASVATRIVNHRDFADRPSFEAALTAALGEAGVDLVCLAGFMRLLSADFVERWRNRLINIHPSLLPAFKGLHVHQRVIEAGVRITGCTVHFVGPEMDDGPIIVQAAVPVAADDTPEGLAERVLAAEHRCYRLALRLIAEGRVAVAGNVVTITGGDPLPAGFLNPREA